MLTEKVWVQNFANQLKAEHFVRIWNCDIVTGKRKSPVGSYYVVGDASEQDERLPINKDCPDLTAVFFVDPTVTETIDGELQKQRVHGETICAIQDCADVPFMTKKEIDEKTGIYWIPESVIDSAKKEFPVFEEFMFWSKYIEAVIAWKKKYLGGV